MSQKLLSCCLYFWRNLKENMFSTTFIIGHHMVIVCECVDIINHQWKAVHCPPSFSVFWSSKKIKHLLNGPMRKLFKKVGWLVPQKQDGYYREKMALCVLHCVLKPEWIVPTISKPWNNLNSIQNIYIIHSLHSLKKQLCFKCIFKL